MTVGGTRVLNPLDSLCLLSSTVFNTRMTRDIPHFSPIRRYTIQLFRKTNRRGFFNAQLTVVHRSILVGFSFRQEVRERRFEEERRLGQTNFPRDRATRRLAPANSRDSEILYNCEHAGRGQTLGRASLMTARPILVRGRPLARDILPPICRRARTATDRRRAPIRIGIRPVNDSEVRRGYS